MLKKFRIPLLIALIISIELAVYLWAVWTVNDIDYIFEKCARNSGKYSAGLNLLILFMLGRYGLIKIYKSQRKKENFKILISLFAINHLIHFFYISQNFRSKVMEIDMSDNIHGIITFVLIMVIPVFFWSFKNLNLSLIHISEPTRPY